MELLQSSNNCNSNFLHSALTDIVKDRQFFKKKIFKADLARLQSRRLCASCKFHAKIAHGNEAANRDCKRMPVTVDTLGETKRDQTEYSC